MKQLFVPYELALKLKEKGFDEFCIAFYIENDTHSLRYFKSVINFDKDGISNTETNTGRVGDLNITAPLYQQVIDWLEKKT